MCVLYRLMFEDVDLEPIDDWDVFDSKRAAIAAFNDAVAHPATDLGSVYLVEDRGDVAVVIAGHYFVDSHDS